MRSCMLYGKFDDSSGVSYWSADRASVNKSLDELGIPYIKEKAEDEAKTEEEAPRSAPISTKPPSRVTLITRT